MRNMKKMKQIKRIRQKCGMATALLLLGGLTACGDGTANAGTVSGVNKVQSEVTGTESENAGAGTQKTEESASQGADTVNKNMAGVQTETEAMKTAYTAILEDVYLNHTFLNGKDYGFDDYFDITENQFAVYDVDGDGEKELIIRYITTAVSGMVEIVYGYDSDSDTAREEFSQFPAVTYFDNGIIEAGWSHNQGLAGDFWPYTLYQYHQESDTYEAVGMADAWEKSFSEKDFNGNLFPEDIDVNGRGIVYYIMQDGKVEYNTPVSSEEYQQWRNSFTGEAEQLNVPFRNLTEENIYGDWESGISSAESAEIPTDNISSYYGTWSIKDCQSADISALSTEEIGNYMDYTVSYEADAVLVNGQSMNVSSPVYEFQPYTEEALVQDYQANLGEWWAGKAQVSCVVVTSSEAFFGDQFFIADEDTLWIYYQGVFFLARKAES